jgi:hypothetical protein
MIVVRILYAIILFLLFHGHVFADITGKIVVIGKWGKSENEFGLDTSEPPGAGPTDFTVSPSGDIYIADIVNKRVVVYNHAGEFLRCVKVDDIINTIEVDTAGRIYYCYGRGLKVINTYGEVIAANKYYGVVHLDQDTIYLWNDGTSFALKLDEKLNQLTLLHKINGTAIGGIIKSNGIEFRRGPSSLVKSTGIAHITINGKPKPISKIVNGKDESMRVTSVYNNAYPLNHLSEFIITEGEYSQVYLKYFDCVVRINTDGILTGKFIPTLDDLKVFGMPYAASGYMRVKNGKVYTMASTDKEFMIIEYEFQPVGDTVEVENEGDGVKKNIKE